MSEPQATKTKTSPVLAVQQVPIATLRRAEYNPRKHSSEQFKQLKTSMSRFGFQEPIIINMAKGREGVIISGHFRTEVAEALNYTEVPAVLVNIPDIKKERELNLRMNANVGSWDIDLLKKFDIEVLMDVGFDDSTLSAIWDDALATEDDDFDVERAVRQIESPQTKPGDLIALGSHRLLCADGTDLAAVKRLVGRDLVSMVDLDPPYNIDLDYSKGISTDGKYGGSTNDRKSEPEYRAFLQSLLANGLAVAQPDCHVFCYCDESYIGMLQGLYPELGISPKRVCLWVKNNLNMTPQIAFNKAYEPCIYGVRGRPYLSPKSKNLTEILNKEVAVGNRSIDDILDIFNIWLAKRDPAVDYEHPTQKPPTLHEKALRRCTKPGDIVLDLTAGSGSLMVACEQLKRRAFMCEIEPIFCDVIVARFESLTGQKAVKL